jgi:predicted nucleic acid-binding protein
MTYLLDTNALSEPSRRRPDAEYMAWFDGTDGDLKYTSVVSLGELRKGVALIEAGPRRDLYERVRREIARRFGARVLVVDETVAVAWGDVAARHRQQSLKVSVTDELIAATAIVHDLTVVTRNVRDFEHAGCKVLSPWSA